MSRNASSSGRDKRRCEKCEDQPAETTLYRDGRVWGQFCLGCHDDLSALAAGQQMTDSDDRVTNEAIQKGHKCSVCGETRNGKAGSGVCIQCKKKAYEPSMTPVKTHSGWEAH